MASIAAARRTQSSYPTYPREHQPLGPQRLGLRPQRRVAPVAASRRLTARSRPARGSTHVAAELVSAARTADQVRGAADLKALGLVIAVGSLDGLDIGPGPPVAVAGRLANPSTGRRDRAHRSRRPGCSASTSVSARVGLSRSRPQAMQPGFGTPSVRPRGWSTRRVVGHRGSQLRGRPGRRRPRLRVRLRHPGAPARGDQRASARLRAADPLRHPGPGGDDGVAAVARQIVRLVPPGADLRVPRHSRAR